MSLDSKPAGCSLTDAVTSLIDELMDLQLETGPDQLVREAAQGHTDAVSDIISKFPDKVRLYLHVVECTGFMLDWIIMNNLEQYGILF